MGETVFTNFLNGVDLVVNSFLIEGYSRLRDACVNPLRLCLTIYVAIYGVLMLNGRVSLSYRDAIGKLGIMLFVYLLATNVDVYTGFLGRLFVDSPAAIANVVVGGGGASGQNAAMDNFTTLAWTPVTRFGIADMLPGRGRRSSAAFWSTPPHWE